MLPLLLAIDAKCRMAPKHVNQWHKKVSWYTEHLQEFVIIVSVAKYNFLLVIQIGCRKVSPHISTMRGTECTLGSDRVRPKNPPMVAQ
jgi:hypothetical protein